MMSAIASMAWGPGLRDLPRPLGDDVITIFGTRTGVYGVVNLCLALLAVLLLTLFFKHLRIGLLMRRSEEHTSELQSLMRISYAVFCLKKKKQKSKPITR